jgi:uncharacterized protein YbaR (Trm112 family)
MLPVLVCPSCKKAYQHDTGHYKTPRACVQCGALLLLRPAPLFHLVLVCRRCHEVFEGLFGQFVPGTPNRCPKCGTPLSLPLVGARPA